MSHCTAWLRICCYGERRKCCNFRPCTGSHTEFSNQHVSLKQGAATSTSYRRVSCCADGEINKHETSSLKNIHTHSDVAIRQPKLTQGKLSVLCIYSDVEFNITYIC